MLTMKFRMDDDAVGVSILISGMPMLLTYWKGQSRRERPETREA